MRKVWMVTGASRGIGAEITRAALQHGDCVVATSRTPHRILDQFGTNPSQLLAPEMDVTNKKQVEEVVRTASEHFGRIDILVNNAGYGQWGAFEENHPEDVELQFRTNVFGVFNVTRSVLPVMRKQRRGHLFNISSVTGIRGGTGNCLYSSTKFAVEGFSESLSHEVKPFGIAVTIIEPGLFRTDFLNNASLRYGEISIDDYSAFSSQIHQKYESRDDRQLGDPAKLGQLIVDLADAAKRPLRLAVGSDAVEAMTTKIESMRSQVEEWRSLSVRTDGEYETVAQ